MALLMQISVYGKPKPNYYPSSDILFNENSTKVFEVDSCVREQKNDFPVPLVTIDMSVTKHFSFQPSVPIEKEQLLSWP